MPKEERDSKMNENTMNEETGSSVLDIDVADLPEPEVLPEGTQVVIVCKKLKSQLLGKPEKTQWPVIWCLYRVEDQPEVPAISKNHFLPFKEENDADTYIENKRKLKKFLANHGLPLSQPDLSEAVGARLEAILGVETWQDEERNTIKRILGPA